MPLYNPTEGLKGYYEPAFNPASIQVAQEQDQLTNLDNVSTSPPTPSAVGGLLKNLAGGLLVFGLGSAALRTSSKYFLNQVVKGIAGRPGEVKSVLSKVAAGFREELKIPNLQGIANNIIERSPDRIVGFRQVAEEVPLIKNALDKYTKFTKPVTEAYESYFSTTKNIEESLRKSGEYSKVKFQSEKLKEFWKKDNFGKRLTGTAERFTTDFLKTLPTFYAVNRLATIGQEPDRPSLLNVPGTLLDFAKFSASWLPMELGFKGAIKGFQLGKMGVAAGLQKAIKPYQPRINKFLANQKVTGRIFDTLTKTTEQIGAFSKAVDYVNNEINVRFRGNFVGKGEDRSILKRQKSIFDTNELKEVYKSAKETYSSQLRYLRSGNKNKQFTEVNLHINNKDVAATVMSNHDEGMLGLINIANTISRGARDGTRRQADIGIALTEFTKLYKQHDISFLGSILGQRLAKRIHAPKAVKQSYAKVFKEIQNSKLLDDGQFKHLKEVFWNSTYGKSVWKVGKGQLADFTAYHPVNLLKASVGLVKNFGAKIPFMKAALKPFDMIMGDTIFGKGPKIHSFSSTQSPYFDHIENYRLSPKLDTKRLQQSLGDKTFWTHINGKFFLYNHGSNSYYSPAEVANKTYMLRPAAEKLQAMQARELIFNNEREKLDAMKKARTVTSSKVKNRLYSFADKQEIGAGFGDTKSIWYRMKGFLQDKLFGKRSDITAAYDQLNDKNFLDKVANGNIGLSEAINPMKIIMAAGKAVDADMAKVVLTPKVLSRLAANTQLKFKGKHITEVMENQKDLIDFHKENFLTAPKNVKDIVSRYSSDHKVLNQINHGYPKIGNALTNADILKYEALKKMLTTNIELNGRVFNEIPSRFMESLSKETGLSKLELSAVNNFGLSVELEALQRQSGLFERTGLPPREGIDHITFIKKFTNKVKEYENQNLMSMTTYLSHMTGRKKADDLLLDTNKYLAREMGVTPYIAIEKNARGIMGTALTYVSERLASMGGLFGLGMDPTRYGGLKGQWHPTQGYWPKRLLQMTAVAGIYNMADTFFDVNPMFNHTMLDEGLTVAFGEQFAKGKLAMARMMDLTGVTKSAQYMEGLMPGSTNTFPGALIGGLAAGPIGVPLGMIANKMIGTYFNWDLTKSYDQLRDIYAGREKVPVRAGRGWELSKSPYEGGRISYYGDSWFHLLKSQYKENPSLYGGKLEGLLLTKPWVGLGFNPLGALLDPYRLERKQYSERPYPITAPLGEDIPLVGPLFAGTIGRIIKPIKKMHPMELQQSYNGIPGGQWQEALLTSALQDRALDPNSSSAVALKGGYSKPINPYELYSTIGNQVYRFTEAAGLMGFMAENTLLAGGVGEARAQLESANRMSSISRAYWDQNLGGGLFTTEFWRRLVPRDKPEVEKRNPLRNQMPSWLPSQGTNYFTRFDIGDPYTKIPKGEARLPGFGYESLRDVKYTMPMRASSLGRDIPDMVASMLGIGDQTTLQEEDIMEEGTAMHRAIQNNLKLANILVKDEALVYDTRHDISGHVDAIIKDGMGGGGKRAVEIKTINAKSFETLTAPKKTHRSQLNFYLSQLDLPVGNLVYVNRDDPSQVKSFTQYFSKDLLERDMIKLEQSRVVASNLLRNGVRGQQIGEAYSHLDRLEILGDVAPWSSEYKEQMKIVQMQQRAGLFTQDETKKIQTIKQHRANVMRRFEFYPKRFGLDQLMDPDAEYTQLNINEHIKAAAEYSLPERIAGGVWESFSHANVPLVNKFWGYKTPLEHYQENVMYGSKNSFWQKPYESFMEPMFRGMLGQDTPLGGLNKWAVPGFLVGGPVGAIGMGALGAVYGSLHGLSGKTYMPNIIQKQRDISTYFDNINYEKNKRLYEQTGDDQYFQNMQQTMTGYNKNPNQRNFVNLFKAVQRPEKDYLDAFINTTNPQERNEILKLIPNDLQGILKNKWGMSDNVQRGFDTNESYFKTHQLPDANWKGWSPDFPIQDFQTVTMKQEGLDAHTIGMGWYEQERRIKNSPWKINPIDINTTTETSNNIDQNQMRYLITNILKKNGVYGSVSIIPINNDSNQVNLTINVSMDRRREMMTAIRGY